MKKNAHIAFIFLIVCSSLFVISCSKDDKEDEIEIIEDKPGEIPGLGSTEGELTGQIFNLPEGIELEDDITGNVGDINTTAKQNRKEIRAARQRSSLKAETNSDLSIDFSRGSGYYVRLAIKLKNTTSGSKNLELPAGLIIKSRSGKYQNGVLLKKVTIDIPANKTILLDLHMYCGNESKSSSSTSENYDFAVISNSSTLHDLINRLKGKKINIEQYFADDEGLDKYDDLIFILQGVLWNLTDSQYGLTDTDIEYINSLPND